MKYYYNLISFIIMTSISFAIQTQFPQKMIISTIVADLREQPQPVPAHVTLPASPTDNPLQTSQLLLGEYVIAHEATIDKEGNTWLRVDALQQKMYNDVDGWQGYPGWIQANQALKVSSFPIYNLVAKNLLVPIFDTDNNQMYQISIGTRLQGIKESSSDYWLITLPDNTQAYIHNNDVNELYENWDISETDLRDTIVQQAKKFLGSDYSWGGRSAQNNTLPISSVDCSATIHLSYLTQGLQIPRMSHEQFLAAQEIEYGKDLQPGDLIMFSTIPNLRRANLKHIDHVMLYIGNDMLLESTMAGDKNVRIISCKQRFGNSIYDIASGDISNTSDYKFYIYFASYLHKPEVIMQLRENATRHIR